jgi:alkylation response protein AidB-like acyl-CoA dehydrogenase
VDLTLTDEQELLAEAVRGLAQDLGTRHPGPVSMGDISAGWDALVDLGVPSLRSPELCGLDATGVEAAIVAEQLGRTLSPAPVLAQSLLSVELLTAARADDHAARVASGELRLGLALAPDLGRIAAPPNGHETSEQVVVLDADGADAVLVVERDEDGWWLVTAEVVVDPDDTLDLTRGIRRASLGPCNRLPGGAAITAELWSGVEACALTLVAADLVGVMQGALDEAVAYASDRRQFGVPIGSFQAVQHMLADAAIRVEGARSCLWHAAWSLGRTPAQHAVLAARTAKASAAAAGRDVVEATVQVFGGIAITWEALAHLRMRRALVDRALLGDERAQYRAIANLRIESPVVG